MREKPYYFSFLLFLTGALSLLLGLLVLYYYHPHEDAYIMYKYVKNFVEGHGIVFNIGGPTSEGATDFLWMISLSSLVFLGFDPAIAGLLLNSLANVGILFIFYTMLNKSSESLNAVVKNLSLLMISIILPLTGASLSSYAGFGTSFYQFGILVCFYMLLCVEAQRLHWLPIMGLTLGMIRPDGLIWSALICILGFFRFYFIYDDRKYFRKYLNFTGIAFILGIVYFVSRAYYFKHILPLPLIVKSQGTSSLPGLRSNMGWLKSSEGIVTSIMFVQALVLSAIRIKIKPILTLSLIVPVSYFCILLFASQSQNVFSRFQDPVIYVICFILFMAIINFNNKKIKVLLPINLVLLLLTIGPFKTKPHGINTYVDNFAIKLGQILSPKDNVVITEAGRIPFWSNANFFDIVGLTNPELVKFDYNIDYVRNKNPELIMYFCGNILDDSKKQLSDSVIFVSSFKDAINLNYKNKVLNYNFKRSDKLTSKANLFLSKFLLNDEENYDIYFVKYLGSYNHLYAVRKNSNLSKVFLDQLNLVFEQPMRSYAQVRNFPFSKK